MHCLPRDRVQGTGHGHTCRVGVAVLLPLHRDVEARQAGEAHGAVQVAVPAAGGGALGCRLLRRPRLPIHVCHVLHIAQLPHAGRGLIVQGSGSGAVSIIVYRSHRCTIKEPHILW